MKFVRVNPNEYIRFKSTKNLEILDEFINSGFEMVRLEGADKEYKNAESCVSSLSASIKRFKRDNIKATVIDGEAFLINTDLVKGDSDGNKED